MQVAVQAQKRIRLLSTTHDPQESQVSNKKRQGSSEDSVAFLNQREQRVLPYSQTNEHKE
jgi:hypothetical protein